MAQFLCDAFEQTQMELVSLKRDKSFDQMLAVNLLNTMSLLGVLKQLPEILSSMKKQFEDQKQAMQVASNRAKDPLAEGE